MRTLFDTTKEILENPHEGWGRGFSLFISGLIIVSMATFALETLPQLPAETRLILRWIEWLTVGVFTIEYLLRILVADQKWKFITSFFGLVDLLAILPFYLAIGIDLRSTRSIRLLRLVRILKLARYNRAMRRFQLAFSIVREEMILFFSATGIFLFLAATGIYYCENQQQPDTFGSVFDALWWAMVTFTTVGYGDSYPITTGGKVFTSLVLLLGLAVVAMPTGLLSSALAKARELEEIEAQSEKADSSQNN